MAVATEVVAFKALNISAGVPIAVAYPMYEETEVDVYYGKAALLAVLNTDYTVTLQPEEFDTFEITPTASLIAKINALIAGDPTETNFVTIRSNLDYETSSTPAAVRYTPFTSREFDRTSRRFSQIQDALNRALILAPTFVGSSPLLQLNEVEPNRALMFNEDGTAIVAGPTADEIAGAQGYAEAASDSADAAAASAADAAAAAASVSLKVVATRTALKALNTVSTTFAMLSESRRVGVFKWTTGDFSTQIALDTLEGVYIKANAVAATAGAWVRQDITFVSPRWFGAVADDLTNDEPPVQASVDIATLLGVRSFIDDGKYNVSNVNCPSDSFIEFSSKAWLRPRTHSNVGAIISNVNVLPKARTNITLVNPQVDGIYLSFTGTSNANDNGVGFATGVSKVRVIGGHIKRMIANFQDGPGGKGVGFEEGVNDVIVWGTRIEDCTYATFVSPTLSDPLKFCWDITFSDLIVERCAAVAWLLSDESTPAALPTPDPTHCSASYFNITAKDVGHFPDRPIATYRAKTGAILLQGFSNLLVRGMRIVNTPGYPSVNAPAGGTAFPTGYPAAGTTFFGAGLSGPPGAPLWGFGRNLDIDIDVNGDFDDVWNIQRCRAHAGDAFGGVIAPVGSSGNRIKVTHRGALDGLINSGVVGASGTVVSATATTVVLPNIANVATRDNVYAGTPISITGGTGSGQSRTMQSYVASTRTATIDTAWTVIPDATSTFNLGSTLAVADGNITGEVEIYSDTPAKELVNTLARFPTGIVLRARNPNTIDIKGSFLDVFNFNNTYASGSTEKGDTYTPTLTNVTNITSSGANLCNYIRMGKTIIVYGFVTFTPTAASAVELDISLPIPSNLTTNFQAIGQCGNNVGNSGTVISNPTNDRARISYTPTSTALQSLSFSFMYNLT